MALALDKEQRARRDALKAELRRLEDPGREAKKIKRAKARAQRERQREQRVDHERVKPKGGRDRDKDYLSWLHDSGLTCIACEIEGPPSAAAVQRWVGRPNVLEGAHQKVSGPKLGVREHDRNTCILCVYHHQCGPSACDKGQRQFWERLAVDAADYCAALFAAFTGGVDPRLVMRRFIPRKDA